MSGTLRYTLTTAWTQIAATGQTVDVQNESVNPVVLGTAATGLPTADGPTLTTLIDHFNETLTSNLFARAINGTAVVAVMDGFSGPGSGGSSPTNYSLETGGNLAQIATTVGQQTDPPATSDTGTFSIVAFIERELQNWTTFLGTLGSQTTASITSPSTNGPIAGILRGILSTLITRLPLDSNNVLKATIVDQFGSSVVYNPTVGVIQAGSVGTDYSANQPAVPNIGSNFANSGPYGNYVLIKTIPALATRSTVSVQNSSGAQILVMLDDGTAASGAAPVNCTLIPLGGGGAVGQQGGSWSEPRFKGRVQIYAPSATAFVTSSIC